MYATPTSPRTLRFAQLPPLPLECGATLAAPTIAYHVDGDLRPGRTDVVLVLHALTGSADAAGEWWKGLIGPGLALDTDRCAVLAPNLLGSCYGSTGPATHDDFPAITTRDMARAVGVLLERLGIRRLALVTGGSLGGMVALELVATFPGLAARATVFAAAAAQPAIAIGWGHVQREALRVGGSDGLHLARQIAMLTYRTPGALEDRFGRLRGAQGAFGVQEWLGAHGSRLTARFDPASYRVLLDAMDTHDVGRGRGGIAERLRASGTVLTGVGITGDAFAPPESVRDWVHVAGGRYRELHSPHGHDAFLIEREQVAALLREGA